MSDDEDDDDEDDDDEDEDYDDDEDEDDSLIHLLWGCPKCGKDARGFVLTYPVAHSDCEDDGILCRRWDGDCIECNRCGETFQSITVKCSSCGYGETISG